MEKTKEFVADVGHSTDEDTPEVNRHGHRDTMATLNSLEPPVFNLPEGTAPDTPEPIYPTEIEAELAEDEEALYLPADNKFTLEINKANSKDSDYSKVSKCSDEPLNHEPSIKMFDNESEGKDVVKSMKSMDEVLC